MSVTPIKPIVLITGASGNLGRSVAKALGGDYKIVGLDREAKEVAPDSDDFPVLVITRGPTCRLSFARAVVHSLR